MAFKTKRLQCSPAVMFELFLLVAMRISYNPADPLDIDKLPTNDPFQLFHLWFGDVKKCEKIVEPNAMTLATANK